jgi:hypothetical protein
VASSGTVLNMYIRNINFNKFVVCARCEHNFCRYINKFVSFRFALFKFLLRKMGNYLYRYVDQE